MKLGSYPPVAKLRGVEVDFGPLTGFHLLMGAHDGLGKVASEAVHRARRRVVSTKVTSIQVSGWLEIFSAPTALQPHIQWSISQTLGVEVSLQWNAQPLAPGSGQCRLRFSGAPGVAGRIARALAGWHYLRFDISEEPSAGCDGSRYLATPTLGLFHASVGGSGDVYLSEHRIRAVVDAALRNGRDVESALEEALGTSWEEELHPFRIGQEGMRWLHVAG